jgi:hypothetical protein
MGELGTVYPHTTSSDDWGTIEVEKGARLTREPRTLFVSAPTSSDMTRGDGWKLSLKPGWKIVPGARRGDHRVVRE